MMDMHKAFGYMCLASAFIAACGQDSFPLGLLGALCVCSVICGLIGWYLMEKHAQQEAQHEINERRKGA